MATGKELRRIALSLEGTTEAPHFDRAAFRVKRTYATMAADERSVNLMLTPDEQEFKCLTAPDAFSPIPNAWGRKGWTILALNKVSTDELESALKAAWAHAVPMAKPRKAPSAARKTT